MMNRKKYFLTTTCLAASVLMLTSPAFANPEGGVVSAGTAVITSADKRVDINQASDRAVIDWRSFDINGDETTEFHQPGSTSITVNRINDTKASIINGNLKANGNLLLLNQNGLLFGGGAKVDVNGIVASTADIDNAKFMNGGKIELSKAGNADAAIVNNGLITAKQAGLVGFVAPNVVNNGVIIADLGTVHLASGDTATVDLYGDGLMDVAVSDKVKSQLIVNTGTIKASGGKIALTAAAGKEIVNSLIMNTGELRAPAMQEKNGEIIIFAEGTNAVKNNIAADKGKKTGSSNVAITGTLDVSGRNPGEKGGKISVAADNVYIMNGTVMDASGYSGTSNTTANGKVSDKREGSAGGEILIGGDYLGGGTTANALNLYVDTYTLFYNDSLNNGDAGRTIFWSDNDTVFKGNVYARALGGLVADPLTKDAMAGLNSGNGGFVETSGHNNLAAGGYVNLSASNGNKGTYFLDPSNITIYGDVDPDFVSTDSSINLSTNLITWIDSSDASKVTLTYSNNGISGTASGTTGTHTITTTVDNSSSLKVGAKIKLGGSNGSIALANATDVDTYTITAISGTTITVAETLSTTYASGTNIYRGLVSQVADKSTGGQGTVTQSNESAMPLWLANGQNGKGTIYYDGGDELDNVAGIFPEYHDYSIFGTVNQTDTSTFGNILSTFSSSGGHAFFFGSGTNIHSYHFGTVASSSDSINVGTPGIVGTTYTESDQTGIVYVNGATSGSGSNGQSPVDSTFAIGAYQGTYNFTGYIDDIFIYSASVTGNVKTLLDQYQSAKWGVALAPSGVSGLGAGEAYSAMASTARSGDTVDGYSVFSTRYLEHLSQSANISLQASNNITLDLQGDNLSLVTNRSLSLTAGGSISSVSTGTITTNGTGGINLTSTGAIDLSTHAVVLNSGGDVAITGGGAISLANITTAANKTVSITGNGVSSAVNLAAINTTNLNLSARGTVLQSDAITSTNLALAGVGGVYNLTNTGNAITTLSADTNTINLVENSGYNIGTANSISGVTATNVNLSTTGTITQTQALSATNLSLSGTGATYTLTNAANAITNFSANTGTVSLTENSGFDIGLVNSITGVNVTNFYLSSTAAVTQTRAINATNLALSGIGGSYTFTNTGNNISTLAGSTGTVNLVEADGFEVGSVNGTNGITTTGNTTITTGGNLAFNNNASAATLVARTTGTTSDITIASGKVVSASASGNALILAASRNFINNAGSTALSTPSGRWLVYSSNPVDTTGEETLSNAFITYDCTYASPGTCASGASVIPASGNGLIFTSLEPVAELPNTVYYTISNKFLEAINHDFITDSNNSDNYQLFVDPDLRKKFDISMLDVR